MSDIMQLDENKFARFYTFAEMIVDSEAYDYTRQGKNRKPLNLDDVVLKLMKGYELGLGMFASLTSLYNEHGKLTLQVDAMLALIRAVGSLEFYQEERSKKKCTIWVKRSGDKGDAVEFTYTLEDAKTMNLTQSANYKNQPDVMLFKRCASKMARTLFPDIVQGIYVEGELTDGTKEEEPWAPDEIVMAQDDDDDEIEENIDDTDDINVEADDEEYDDDDDIEYIDHFVDMIDSQNLDVTPEQYIHGMNEFGAWCAEKELDEDDVFNILEGLNYAFFWGVDQDGEGVQLLPWSPRLDEPYKKAIETHLKLNMIGVDEDLEIEDIKEHDVEIDEEADDGDEYITGEDDIDDAINDQLEQDEENDADDNEEESEEDEGWSDWDNDDWEVEDDD